MSDKPAVTVIGLGAMGHAFASNLLKNGFAVTAWNRTRARGEDLISSGLVLKDNPKDAVENADVILLMLSDADATEAMTDNILSSLKPGATFCQMGTIGIESTDKLIHLFASNRPDVCFIDAPVSGTKGPAERAQILILASGEKREAENAEIVFSAIGKRTQWLGEAGRSTRMKLVANTWLILMMQGLSESLLLADEFNFTEEEFWSVLEDGPLAAAYAKAKIDMIKADNYAPQMQLKWACKDAQLALDSVSSASRLPALSKTVDIWRNALNEGFGEQDLSVVYPFQKRTDNQAN